MPRYDLAVIGGGPAGYVGAIRASGLGAKVVLIEKGELGGTCLNLGCIPTKALLASAKRYKQCKEASAFGVGIGENLSFDMKVASERVKRVVQTLRGGIAQLLKANKIDVINGRAEFVNANQISIDIDHPSTVTADHHLIATGSTWVDLPGIPVDGKHICTSDQALFWDFVPSELVIIGGGVIGCEFASLFSSLGSRVTIVEAMPSILPNMEDSMTRLFLNDLKRSGVQVYTSATVDRALVKDGRVDVGLKTHQLIIADKLLISIGRRPNTAGLNLEKAGVQINSKGFIIVDEYLKSTNDKIYAAGDVIEGPMLAHMASHEALLAVENIFGKKKSYDRTVVPSPVFTMPELASVGRTSAELKSDGVSFTTGRFSYLASGRALCDGLTQGQCIVHVDSDNNKLLGAHFYGVASDLLLSEAALAIGKGLTVKDVVSIPHAHPTLSEVFSEAMCDAVGEAIHKVKRNEA